MKKKHLQISFAGGFLGEEANCTCLSWLPVVIPNLVMIATAALAHQNRKSAK